MAIEIISSIMHILNFVLIVGAALIMRDWASD